MTPLENRILFYLIEPEGCWDEHVFYYPCSKTVCETPDFTTPEWRIRLQEWLFAPEQEPFWIAFTGWAWGYVYRYFPILMNNLNDALLSFLRTDEARERWGWTECPCPPEFKGDEEVKRVCPYCNGTGKIRAKWMEEK